MISPVNNNLTGLVFESSNDKLELDTLFPNYPLETNSFEQEMTLGHLAKFPNLAPKIKEI